MILIVGGRGSGKTTKLIKKSSHSGSLIVCRSLFEARDIIRQAKELGFSIPEPISYDQLLKANLVKKDQGVLIDNAESFIRYAARARVDAIVFTDRNECAFEVKEFNEPSRLQPIETPQWKGKPL